MRSQYYVGLGRHKHHSSVMLQLTSNFNISLVSGSISIMSSSIADFYTAILHNDCAVYTICHRRRSRICHVCHSIPTFTRGYARHTHETHHGNENLKILTQNHILYRSCTYINLSKIMKIGWHQAKLLQNIKGDVFIGPFCIMPIV